MSEKIDAIYNIVTSGTLNTYEQLYGKILSNPTAANTFFNETYTITQDVASRYRYILVACVSYGKSGTTYGGTYIDSSTSNIVFSDHFDSNNSVDWAESINATALIASGDNDITINIKNRGYSCYRIYGIA